MKSDATARSTRNIPACGALPGGSRAGAGDCPCDVLDCGFLC